MLTLILLVVFGILAALFASQNTTSASITFATYTLEAIPMYLIVLGSVLAGLLFSSIISMAQSISSSFTLHGKDVKIRKSNNSLVELTKHIHQLELENARLKEHTTITDERSL